MYILEGPTGYLENWPYIVTSETYPNKTIRFKENFWKIGQKIK